MVVLVVLSCMVIVGSWARWSWAQARGLQNGIHSLSRLQPGQPVCPPDGAWLMFTVFGTTENLHPKSPASPVPQIYANGAQQLFHLPVNFCIS